MRAIRIHPEDSVAVALEVLAAGEEITVGGNTIILRDPIPAGHKFTLVPLPAGAVVRKYGEPIGRTTCALPAGAYLHSQQMCSLLDGLADYEYRPALRQTAPLPPGTFQGYRRADGQVGIRNEIWILPTVGCVNAVASAVEQRAQAYLTPEIDGIYAYHHPYGCSQLGGDLEATLHLLCGMIRHPNAGGVLVLGLGCENGNIGELKQRLGAYDERRVQFLVCQDAEDEVAAALEKLELLCANARKARREPCPTSALVVGLKCGGSDGFSGITANPLLGSLTDRLTAEGASAILTEVPEMFGAETILMNRCRSRAVFDDTVRLINDFKRYFMRYGERIDENPSPGNKAGGITTLAEKSLGCIQKGGKSTVEDVLQYAQPVRVHGLSLLCAPGNDLVASCALAASGAQFVLFSTGRGTPFGCPVPTVKLSSNTPLAEKKRGWIDFDAGTLLSGRSMPELTDGLYRYVLALASGDVRAKAEAFDRHTLAIFKDGVTL